MIASNVLLFSKYNITVQIKCCQTVNIVVHINIKTPFVILNIISFAKATSLFELHVYV